MYFYSRFIIKKRISVEINNKCEIQEQIIPNISKIFTQSEIKSLKEKSHNEIICTECSKKYRF